MAEAHEELLRTALSPAKEGPAPHGEEVPPPEIVVVAYGPTPPLAEALRPLGEYSVTIVDNSSSEETRLLAERTGARYIDPGANLGFGTGVNRGLQDLAARGRSDRDVLLLNPDAAVAPSAIRLLQDELRRRPELACAAPVQRHPETGRPERVAWPFPSPSGAWLEAVGLGRLDRRAGFVIGSVLLLRAAAVADVGHFDERFFLYAEETDWQRRAVSRGWSTGIVPAATATHVGAGTGGDSTRRMEMFNTSLLEYMSKHHGRRGELSYRTAVLGGALLRRILASGEVRERSRWRLGFYTSAPRPAGAQEQPLWI
ncbi:glycosyltransferase family 2 protein [Nesterenkonia pannonica]|uniref:glycosyltransferase family 2 protein n=1 Tax=Nesterenkonia pannonica TaxID=1548602 RepID=UPI0021646516|nr:glycosyltransferase family 2 protein [Nesterenkonia pannonica]